MKYLWKFIYVLASIVEFITGAEYEEDKFEKYSDGVGGYIVNGESMSKEEIEAHNFTTGMYNDY
ncbi:MAG: hypothetical protein COB83_05075 [Gammaproteobacteria bacterium]|nr:MAG: hypothetical protein COB83_05075 [Gammaproteobacteria bacterium]